MRLYQFPYANENGDKVEVDSFASGSPDEACLKRGLKRSVAKQPDQHTPASSLVSLAVNKENAASALTASWAESD